MWVKQKTITQVRISPVDTCVRIWLLCFASGSAAITTNLCPVYCGVVSSPRLCEKCIFSRMKVQKSVALAVLGRKNKWSSIKFHFVATPAAATLIKRKSIALAIRRRHRATDKSTSISPPPKIITALAASSRLIHKSQCRHRRRILSSVDPSGEIKFGSFPDDAELITC